MLLSDFLSFLYNLSFLSVCFKDFLLTFVVLKFPHSGPMCGFFFPPKSCLGFCHVSVLRLRPDYNFRKIFICYLFYYHLPSIIPSLVFWSWLS